MEQYLATNVDVACKELRVVCKDNSLTEGRKRAKETRKVYWFCVEDLVD
jgi:hypothetical protein